MAALLEIKDLTVSFSLRTGEVQAVRGVSFALNRGETLAIVGESGCGKSVTAQAIMRLLPCPPGRVADGSVLFEERQLLGCSEAEMTGVRGNHISIISQNPVTALNPTITVGSQIAEVVRTHWQADRGQARRRALEMLHLVGIPDPERRYSQYPHEYSGGMCQRAMIAMALACEPKVLIADEPTSALDVTVQAQVLNVMHDLQVRLGTAMILITHDLGIVADVCSRVLVMYAGRIVESGGVEDIFHRAGHPYTLGLLACMPRLDQGDPRGPSPITGQPPQMSRPPRGCAFAPRCGDVLRVCLQYQPPEFQLGDGHSAACWRLHPRAGAVSSSLTPDEYGVVS